MQIPRMAAALLATLLVSMVSQAASCDRGCLTRIADAYRAAFLAHDPARAPFARRVGFSENNVSMQFPDGTWDTVTEEIGPPLTLVDPVTQSVGIFTTIRQKDTPAFIAIRLHVKSERIDEVEHIVSSKRNVNATDALRRRGFVQARRPDAEGGAACAASSARGADLARRRLLRDLAEQHR